MNNEKLDNEKLEEISYEEVIDIMFKKDDETKELLEKLGIEIDILEISNFDI